VRWTAQLAGGVGLVPGDVRAAGNDGNLYIQATQGSNQEAGASIHQLVSFVSRVVGQI